MKLRRHLLNEHLSPKLNAFASLCRITLDVVKFVANMHRVEVLQLLDIELCARLADLVEVELLNHALQ